MQKWLSTYEPPFIYEAEGTWVHDTEGSKVLDIRGWGHLTSPNFGNLPTEIAEQAQDAFGEKVAELLNDWQQLH